MGLAQVLLVTTTAEKEKEKVTTTSGEENVSPAQDVWKHYDHVEGPQLDTATFVPTKEWLSQKLQVPVTDCIATVKKGGGEGGASGAKFFHCEVKYAGTELEPTYGMPTQLFVKLRTPEQPITEFAAEFVVGNLARHMVDPPPMARVFCAGPHSVICENLKNELSMKQWHSSGEGGDKCELETGIEILKAFAHLHASFWKLPHVVGLK